MKRYRAENKKNKMKIALIIGHHTHSQGAVNKGTGVSEFLYNEKLVAMIHDKMIDSDIIIELVYRNTYSRLPDKVNALNPDWAVSFHCNAYNKEVGGTEVLYHHTNKQAKWLAVQFQEALVDLFNLKDRGIKPVVSEGRGGYLLKYVNAPCVILEPFFIDNNTEFRLGMNKMEGYANMVVNVLRSLPKSGVK